MRWGLITALLLGVTLSGCVTFAEQVANERMERLKASDDAECRSYGAVPGSEAYIQCRTTKSQQHELALAQVDAASMARPRPVFGAPRPRNCFVTPGMVNCY